MTIVNVCSRFDRAHPRSTAPVATSVDIRTALVTSYPDDRHFQALSTSCPGRVSSSSVGLVRIEMTCFAVDLDAHLDGRKIDGIAPLSWRLEVLDRVRSLPFEKPCVFWTKAGARLVWSLDTPIPIASAEDARTWRATYEAWARRLTGLEPDLSCSDFSRLYRLPLVCRDGRSTLDDELFRSSLPDRTIIRGVEKMETWATELTPAEVEALESARRPLTGDKAWRGQSNVASDLSDTSVASRVSLLHSLFSSRGWLHDELAGGKAYVDCPWGPRGTGDHGSTSTGDTVLFAPTEPNGVGGFFCHHHTCKGRGAIDALNAFSPAEKRAAGVIDSREHDTDGDELIELTLTFEKKTDSSLRVRREDGEVIILPYRANVRLLTRAPRPGSTVRVSLPRWLARDRNLLE